MSDPEVMDSLAVIRETHIPVYLILTILEDGMNIDQVLLECPHLQPEHA